ncbi:MFS general substrate transporter [Penicillium capsulatum]|uniref:MFS general substrate transporter n=1 Tax=Penicillium capsulatum TaxID=69766 RepID=A0A9W9IKG2_9EURO|nr:MFS general substrate transporter [Penicillium capsulatum]
MAIASFTAGTIVASRAMSGTTLLVGRSIQGLGAGGITNLSEVILTDLVPLRLRGRYLAYLNSVWALGSTTGPVIGAAFAQKVTWRWIFYINLPLIAAGCALLAMATPFKSPPAAVGRKIENIDLAGILLFTAGIISVLIPITWGGTMYPWSSWHTVVPLVVGCVVLLSFVVYESYVAAEPVIQMALFRTRSLVVSYISTVTHGLILSCGLYYLPFYFQAVQGYSPVISGVALFPVTFTVVPGAMATGVFISRTGHYRGIIWAGWLVTMVGLGLTCLVRVNTPNVLWIVCLVVIGLGIGILFSSLNIAVLAAAKQQHQQAAAATMFTFFRALGQTLGVAIGGTIFSNRVRASLLAQPAVLAMSRTASGGHHLDVVALVQLTDQTSDPTSRDQLRKVYVDSLRVVWAVCCAMSGVTALVSLGLRRYNLSRTTTREAPQDITITSVETRGK